MPNYRKRAAILIAQRANFKVSGGVTSLAGTFLLKLTAIRGLFTSQAQRVSYTDFAQVKLQETITTPLACLTLWLLLLRLVSFLPLAELWNSQHGLSTNYHGFCQNIAHTNSQDRLPCFLVRRKKNLPQIKKPSQVVSRGYKDGGY